MNNLASTPTWFLGKGTRVAAVTENVATMVDLDDRELAARLWDAQRTSGADGALEVLLGGGIIAIPDFVLIEVEGDTYRVVIRGKARVTADTEAGPSTYEGANVRLAAEHVIASPASVVAGFGGTMPDLVAQDGTTGGTLFAAADCAISSGFGFFDWIAASATSYQLDMPTLNYPNAPAADGLGEGDRFDVEVVESSDGDLATAPPQFQASFDDAAEPPPFANALISAAEVAEVPDASESEAYGETEAYGEAPVLGEAQVLGGVEGRVDDAAEIDTAELPDEFVPGNVPNVGPIATPNPGDAGEHDLASTVAPHTSNAAEQEIEGEAGDDGRYASIFGATMQRSVIDAAIREEGEEGAEGGAPDIERPGADGAEAPVVAETQSAPLESIDASAESKRPFGDRSHVATDTVPPFERDVDGHTLPPNRDEEQTLYPTAEEQRGDHDGHTVSRADLPSTGSPVPMWGASGSGDADGSDSVDSERPHVQSIRCADGHDNPPQRSECGRCQRPLDSEPVMVPRPPLGTLTFSTGDELVLDRPVLVGRKPDLAGLACSELPIEFAIEVGDGLSRSHALFSIAGWQVRVEDLGSTNHTTIRLPDQSPQRLRVGEPVPITDGTLIDLGGEVTCRYDVNI